MRVLIYEPFASGHRLQFVRMCVEAIGDAAGEIVFATTASTAASGEFATHIPPVRDRITLDTSTRVEHTSPMRAAAGRLITLRGMLNRHKPDHLYVPYADGVAQAASAGRLFGLSPRCDGMEIEGVIMRGRFAYPNKHWHDALFARAWLATTARAPFDILHLLDPIPFEAIERRGGALAGRCRLIPEPVEPMTLVDRRDARARLGLPLDGRLLCCPGQLSHRKGADLLIRAFETASLRPDDRLLLMGQMDKHIHGELARVDALVRSGRVIAMPGCRSDEELHLGMSAADVVCTPYPRHTGSSGIVVRAAALQRMVLASDFGWVGMVTERFGLGVTCDCTRSETIARLLPAALDRSAAFGSSEIAGRFTAYHTLDNFVAHLSARLRERRGMPAPIGMMSWSRVIGGS